MKPHTKTLFAILFGVPFLLAGLCAAVVFAVSRSGSLELSIHQKGGGGQVQVRLPALLVPMTMALARLPLHGCCDQDGDCTIPWNVVSNSLQALSDCPDGVLVDMRTSEDVVRIEKHAGRLVVYIDTPDETVNAAIPLGTARAVLAPI